MATDDDQVFSSEAELARVQALSGCYRIAAGTWDRVDANVARLVSVDSLRLDTQMIPRRGTYLVAPAPRAYEEGDGFWYPVGAEHVTVVWTVGLAGERLVLKQQRDSLVGRWSVGSDTRTEWVGGRIALARVPCPAPEPRP